MAYLDQSLRDILLNGMSIRFVECRVMKKRCENYSHKKEKEFIENEPLKSLRRNAKKVEWYIRSSNRWGLAWHQERIYSCVLLEKENDTQHCELFAYVYKRTYIVRRVLGGALAKAIATKFIM